MSVLALGRAVARGGARRALLRPPFSTARRAPSRAKAMPARSSSRFNPNQRAVEEDGVSSMPEMSEMSHGQMRAGPGGIDASLVAVGKSTRSPAQREQRRNVIRHFLEANDGGNL